MDTAGKVIDCKAAVVWAASEPMKMETIQVAAPKAGEVRVKMVSAALCHTDLFIKRGGLSDAVFPCVLGHEGAGIVESVGDGVTSVVPGDHVIPSFAALCSKCDLCQSPETNICLANGFFQDAGLLNDGTTRFTCNGQDIKHTMGCSTFSEYIVVNEHNLCKINPAAPLDKVCLIGCGISTGYGAAIRTANVRPGSTVAVWGLGAVGLAVVMGAKKAAASRIIGVDINPAKEEIAKTFGITDFVNPNDHEESADLVIQKMTNGGVDYAFECCGIPKCMETALEACKHGLSVLTIVGVADLTAEVRYNPIKLIYGRSVKGTFFGGFKSREDVPKLVEEYLAGDLKVDEFITHTLPIESINDAVDMLKKGESLRTVLLF